MGGTIIKPVEEYIQPVEKFLTDSWNSVSGAVVDTAKSAKDRVESDLTEFDDNHPQYKDVGTVFVDRIKGIRDWPEKVARTVEENPTFHRAKKDYLDPINDNVFRPIGEFGEAVWEKLRNIKVPDINV